MVPLIVTFVKCEETAPKVTAALSESGLYVLRAIDTFLRDIESNVCLILIFFDSFSHDIIFRDVSVLVGKDIELDAVGRLRLHRWRPCAVTWDAVPDQSWY